MQRNFENAINNEYAVNSEYATNHQFFNLLVDFYNHWNSTQRMVADMKYQAGHATHI